MHVPAPLDLRPTATQSLAVADFARLVAILTDPSRCPRCGSWRTARHPARWDGDCVNYAFPQRVIC